MHTMRPPTRVHEIDNAERRAPGTQEKNANVQLCARDGVNLARDVQDPDEVLP